MSYFWRCSRTYPLTQSITFFLLKQICGKDFQRITIQKYSRCAFVKISLVTRMSAIFQKQSIQSSRCISRKSYQFPDIAENDVEEQFVRGSGPGGQSVAKNSNCCVLKHLPTGIVVKCHESRSLTQNRKLAREKLKEKLDIHINGENSYIVQEAKEGREDRAAKKYKNKKNLEIKKAFKEKMEKMGLD